MTEELKPCKCGTEPTMVDNMTAIEGTGKVIMLYSVVCLDCDPRIKNAQDFLSREEAIEAWNERVKDEE